MFGITREPEMNAVFLQHHIIAAMIRVCVCAFYVDVSNQRCEDCVIMRGRNLRQSMRLVHSEKANIINLFNTNNYLKELL